MGTSISPLNLILPHSPRSFLAPEKASATELAFAMQIMSRRKKKEGGNQWSCINLLPANVLGILILDPFPAIPETNHHCPPRPHLSPFTLRRSQRCHIRRGKSTTQGFFEERHSNCHLEMCSAGLGPRHNRLKREKSENGEGGRRGETSHCLVNTTFNPCGHCHNILICVTNLVRVIR